MMPRWIIIFCFHHVKSLPFHKSLTRHSPSGTVIPIRAPLPGMPVSQIVIPLIDGFSREMANPSPRSQQRWRHIDLFSTAHVLPWLMYAYQRQASHLLNERFCNFNTFGFIVDAEYPDGT